MSFPIGIGFWKQQGGGCPSYTPGLYTAEKIDQMVFVDGYIPVASAAEFDKIRTGNLEDMGVGTCWDGKYSTGLDKKYVQVKAITFTASIDPIGDSGDRFRGVFDGNNLDFINCTINDAGALTSLFVGTIAQGQSCEVRHMNVVNGTLTSTGAGCGFIMSNVATGSICEENKIDANLTGFNRIGGVVGAVSGGICRRNEFQGEVETTDNNTLTEKGGFIAGEVEAGECYQNVVRNASIRSANRTNGGIAARQSGGNIYANKIENTVDFSGCSNGRVGGIVGVQVSGVCENNLNETDITIVSTGNSVGGIVGVIGADSTGGGTVRRNKNTGNISFTGAGTLIVGGIAGQVRGISSVVEDNEQLGDVNGVTEVGGQIGRIQDSPSVIDRGFSAGAVTGSSFVGGFAGRHFNGSNPTANAYWDTDIGPATSAGGTGKTTSELQTPTTNSGIYSAWTIPPWDFGASNEYPTLTTTP